MHVKDVYKSSCLWLAFHIKTFYSLGKEIMGTLIKKGIAGLHEISIREMEDKIMWKKDQQVIRTERHKVCCLWIVHFNWGKSDGRKKGGHLLWKNKFIILGSLHQGLTNNCLSVSVQLRDCGWFYIFKWLRKMEGRWMLCDTWKLYRISVSLPENEALLAHGHTNSYLQAAENVQPAKPNYLVLFPYRKRLFTPALVIMLIF